MIHKSGTSEGWRAFLKGSRLIVNNDSETIPAAAQVIFLSFGTDV
jgi:hypothetical protein